MSEFVDLSGDVFSVDKVGRYWRVLWNGKIIRTFTDADGETRAHGYALALLDGRELRRLNTQRYGKEEI